MKVLETIISTRNEDSSTHLAPMGMWKEKDKVIFAPFNPSTTLENLKRESHAVVNYTDDARVFAGCITGRKLWPLRKATQVNVHRLEAALSHSEIKVVEILDDATRPFCRCEVIHEEMHAPFNGFNRAQSSIIELAILVSRLDRLPIEKIYNEIAYLQIAIDKTAGDEEFEAWSWLMYEVEEHIRSQNAG